MLFENKNEVSGTSVALLGFGRANRAVADFLLPLGARLFVYDEREVPDNVRFAYEARGAQFRVGSLPESLSEEVLVRSPGLRPDLPVIRRALAGGACLTGECELFLSLTEATTVGVTGSDGKTTTANLAARLLAAAGRRVLLGGNNGVPLLPRAGDLRQGDFAVVELSSFQLMTLKRPTDIAIITNITPNHLNWHTDMAEYIAAKQHIYGEQTRLVLNADNPVTRELAATRKDNTVLFSTDRESVRSRSDGSACYIEGNAVVLEENGAARRYDCLDAFRLPGRHNLENLLAATAATAEYLTPTAPRRALADFSGVAHRLQYAGCAGEVHYYNSSIDTTPTRTAAALSALGGSPLVLLGGRGKGVSFAPLAAALQHAKGAFLFGEAAGELEEALQGVLPLQCFTRFRDAFAAAAAAAMPGDTVLLSPACTAFDEFRDFEERGEVFCAMVARLAAERK